MNPCFFTAPSPLPVFAIVGVLGSRVADCNSIFSVQTFTQQTSCRNAQVRVLKNRANYSTSLSWAKRPRCEIHLHPSSRYGWSILSRI